MTDAARRQTLDRADVETRRRAQSVFDRPLIVEAGAGTGKTSILVARIVVWSLHAGWQRAQARLETAAPAGRLVALEDVAAEVLGRVAAITFTDAAAAEMAQRTGAALNEIARGDVPRGVSEALLPSDAKVRQVRARALGGALDHLVVRTIHAFCRGILAQYPLEARLHPGFQVDADERVQAEVVREAVEVAVRAGYSEPGDPDLIALAVYGVGPARIEAALLRLVAAGVSPQAFDADPFDPEQIAPLVADLGQAVASFQRADGGRLASVSRGKNTLIASDAVESTRRLIDRGAVASVAALDSVAEELRSLWEGAALARLKEWGKARFNKGEGEALEDAVDAVSRRAAELSERLDHFAALAPERLQRARRSLQPLLARVREELRRRGAATFASLLRDTRDLLAAHPDVCRRLRGDLDQLLVDEFQDTDPLQCDIIRWIALSGPPEARPSLFLVGDPKQSIYGWRNADLRAYDDFVAEVLGEGGEPDRLSRNFRSLPALLDEVERAIEPVMQREIGVQPGFQALIPDRNAPAAAAPAVEYWVSWDRAGDGDEPGPPSAARAAEIEAAAIADDLHERHAKGELCLGAVGILFRSTGDLEVYLQALRSAGVPYSVERDRGYFRRREIIEASSLVRCVLDRNDQLALLAWLRSVSVGVPDAALLPLWKRDLPRLAGDLHGAEVSAIARLGEVIAAAAAEVPEDVPGIERVRGWELSLRQALAAIGLLRASFEEDPADVFVEKLRSVTLLEATEAARYLGAYRVANLDRFFRDLLAELETSGDSESLLRRLRSGVTEGREAEQARPSGEEDAVRVMTIHKAKGLDFDHTYVVQLHKQSGRRAGASSEAEVEAIDGRFEYRLFGAPTLGFRAVDEQRSRVERAERVRSLYVAMTRARNRLVLLGSWPRDALAVAAPAARCHRDLLASRGSGIPDLAGEMRRLAAAGGADGVAAAGAQWIFPALRRPLQTASAAAIVDGGLPSAAAWREAAADLRERRAAAAQRAERPWNAAPSADSHAGERELLADRRFGDAPQPQRSPAAARVAGTVVHRILQDFDLGADPLLELARQGGRLPDLVGALAGAGEYAGALARAEEALAALGRGSLVARLCRLAEHVVARELPVLLPPEADGPGAIAFRAGSIDLCYRDPETGEWVVADYKTDRIASEADVANCVAQYTEQGRCYQRALRDFLGLAADPRFELWLLDADRVEVVA